MNIKTRSVLESLGDFSEELVEKLNQDRNAGGHLTMQLGAHIMADIVEFYVR